MSHFAASTSEDRSADPAGPAPAETGDLPDGRFRSILYGASHAPAGLDARPEPACFHDLNLDQVVASLTAAKEPYRLQGYFHAPLDDIDTVNYRQEVFRDLERQPVHAVVDGFADGMLRMRDGLGRAEQARYHHQTQRWFLDAATSFCRTVERLAAELAAAAPCSQGLREVESYLTTYLASPRFHELRDDVAGVTVGLDRVRYNVWVHDAKVTVGAYDDEPDYSAEVTGTFERFAQSRRREATAPPTTRTRRPVRRDDFMDHVEGQILDQVVKVFPEPFAALDTFCERHRGYLDPTIATLDRELQFYVAYLDYVEPLRRAGLPLGYPRLSSGSKDENAADTFDVALAAQLLRDQHRNTNPVVCNDLCLDGTERILVVSGPNNGGKTTLARTVGQLHYLARLGAPVPGRNVRLHLVDEIYTHFEKEEDIATLAGKLQDELNRLHEDFLHATPRSLVIMNEMFSSTTVDDALFLSQEMLGRVSDLDALGVCVTFLDELASLNEKTVSMVSTVEPDDLAKRTFKVVRKAADGRAYAQALAQKYGLTYPQLTGRVGS